MYVERGLTTVGKEENICSMVVFPYNEDDVKEQFQVEDVDELRFMDNPDSRLSVGRFNDIMREAEDRMEKLSGEIDHTVTFLKKKMAANQDKKWKGISDTIPLNFEDSLVWHWCMKRDYKHRDEMVKVWKYGNDLTVLYGNGEHGA